MTREEAKKPCEDAVNKTPNKCLRCQHRQGNLCIRPMDIECIPSVTQKSGKWIRKESMGYPIEICSKCGEIGDSAYNFCPWCGAKMESEG